MTSKPRPTRDAAPLCSQTIPAAASSGKQKIVTTTNLIGNRVNPRAGASDFKILRSRPESPIAQSTPAKASNPRKVVVLSRTFTTASTASSTVTMPA